MDKFLVAEPATSTSNKRKALPSGTGQKTLQQCKKTVVLRGHTAMNFNVEHIYACKTILEDDTSTSDDKLEQLRILSVMHVSMEHLLETKIGHLVRKLSRDADAEVKKLAQRLLDKWMTQTLQERAGKRKRRASPTASKQDKAK